MKVEDSNCGKYASQVILEQQIEMLEELIKQLSERICYLENKVN